MTTAKAAAYFWLLIVSFNHHHHVEVPHHPVGRAVVRRSEVSA